MSLRALRKYGVAATIKFSIFESDGIDFRVDAVHAAGDTKISKDEGAEINTTNGFVDEGTGYSIVLTATEMQAARIEVFVVDQTDPKVWLDKPLVIETYGNTASQHGFDLNLPLTDEPIYDNKIWVNTTGGGSAGTVSNVNGTRGNPSSNIADALTLSGSENIDTIHFSSLSSITAAASIVNKVLEGDNWTIALGGQNFANTLIKDANLSGICTGAIVSMDDCNLSSCTLPAGVFRRCGFLGTITIASAAEYTFDKCYDRTSGATPPSIDFASQANTDVKNTHYDGRIEVENMNSTGTDTMVLTGSGELTLNANNAFGAAITLSNDFSVIDNASANVALTRTISLSDLRQIIGTTLVEDTLGRIAKNVEFFFENGDAQTPKIVDDVGTSILTGPKDFFALSQTETEVNVISGGFADTAAIGGDQFIFARTATDLDLRLNFNVGANIKMTSFQVLAGLDTSGQRTAEIQLFDFVGAQFDFFDTMTDSSSELDFFPHSGVDPKYTDTNGDVIIRFKSVDLQLANRINVDLAKVTAIVDAGSIPSSSEIAQDVWLLGDTLHGKGPYRGASLAFTEVDTATSQTEFILNSGPTQDITQSGVIVLFTDKDNKDNIGLGTVVSWTAATLTLIIESEVGFVVAAGDNVDMFLASTAVDIKDNDVNKKIIAQAIKEFDSSVLSIGANSLLQEIFSQVFDVNLIQVDGAINADGQSFNLVFQLAAAMAAGRFELDTPVDGQTTYFKFDGITPLFVVATTNKIRSRIS